MAKKKAKDDLDLNDDKDDEKGNPFVNILIVMVIIAIWLAIFGLLIKMDVGGVGRMLRPYLKNIPVINRILPDASDEEIQEETGYKYKNLAEAIERIKELEKELANYQESGNASQELIAQLRAEVERLRVFEQQQQYYQQLKEQFDREVVYADNAPDIEEYKKWYEALDPENAAKLYEEVIQRISYSKKVQEWADTFAKMEPANAAAILGEMTGDTDLAAQILMSLTAQQRANIMAQMDPVFAAKLTKIMYP